MGRHLIQQQDWRGAKIGRKSAGIGEDQADQQGLLLACGTLVGGHGFRSVDGGHIGAVRAYKRASGGNIAAAVIRQGLRQITCRNGIFAVGADQRQISHWESGLHPHLRRDQPRKRRITVLHDCGPGNGHLAFQRAIPMRIGHLIFQQPVAIPHGLFVGQHRFGMIWGKAKRHAVQKPAAALCGLDPQAVHHRHQPDHAQNAGKADLGGRLAINQHLPPFARLGPGLDQVRRPQALNIGGDFPSQSFGPARHVIRRSPAQATTGRQQRDCLKNIGLSRAIGPHNRHRTAIKRQPRRLVAAKMRQGQRCDGQPGHAPLAFHFGLNIPGVRGLAPAFFGGPKPPAFVTPALA